MTIDTVGALRSILAKYDDDMPLISSGGGDDDNWYRVLSAKPCGGIAGQMLCIYPDVFAIGDEPEVIDV